MNRIEKILAAKRAEQVARMEGREPPPPVELEPPVLQQRPPPSRRNSRRLKFSKHARERMAHRLMRPADIYALFISGERQPQLGGCARYKATKTALAEAAPEHRRSLERFSGSYIVVNEDDFILVTVVHDGEDSW